MRKKKEIWKPVPDYEGLYEASSTGRIKSLEREVNFRFGKKRAEPGRILTPNIRPDGYATVALYRDGENRQWRVHRIIALTFIPNPENKRCVNHKNGKRSDNRRENLEWATHSENTLHGFRVLKTTHPCLGKKRPKSVVDKIMKSKRQHYQTIVNDDPNVTECRLSEFNNLFDPEKHIGFTIGKNGKRVYEKLISYESGNATATLADHSKWQYIRKHQTVRIHNKLSELLNQSK